MCTVGTALYKPSLTSISKYQYKTPDYTKPQPQVINQLYTDKQGNQGIKLVLVCLVLSNDFN